MSNDNDLQSFSPQTFSPLKGYTVEAVRMPDTDVHEHCWGAVTSAEVAGRYVLTRHCYVCGVDDTEAAT